MRSVIVCLVLVAALASAARAQPAEPTPPEPAQPPPESAPMPPEPQPVQPPPAPEPQPAPAPPPAPPPPAAPGATPTDDYQACLAERRRRSRYAQTLTDVNERARILQEMPECKDPNAVVAPLVPLPPPRTGGTAEVNIGLGILRGEGDTLNGVGFSLGFGGFLSRQIALTGRFSGAGAHEEDFLIYLGFLGPAIQMWPADQFWIGGGLGIGIIAACADECDSETSSGVDLRAGVSLSPPESNHSTNLSIEYTAYDLSGTDLSTVSILLGYQSL